MLDKLNIYTVHCHARQKAGCTNPVYLIIKTEDIYNYKPKSYNIVQYFLNDTQSCTLHTQKRSCDKPAADL